MSTFFQIYILNAESESVHYRTRLYRYTYIIIKYHTQCPEWVLYIYLFIYKRETNKTI